MDDKEKEKFGVVIEKEKQPEGDQSKVEEKTLESENLTPKTENNDFLEKKQPENENNPDASNQEIASEENSENKTDESNQESVSEENETVTQENNNEEKKIFQNFSNNEELIIASSKDSVQLNQEFTEPPSRYTEGSIIKILESKGIGRPSTYASIIDTLLNQREYIKREKAGLKVTKLGSVVNKMLTQYYPKYVEADFTAKVEGNLDEIASGNLPWIDFVSDFYKPFKKNLDEALEKAERIPSSYFHQETGISCKECESPIVIKNGRNGRFLACSGFPNCRNILGSLSLRIKVAVEQSRPDCLKNCLGDSHCINCAHLECPKCQSDLIERQSKKSKIYYSCFDYKNCDYFVTRTLYLELPCKECGSLVINVGRKQVKCEKCEWIGEKQS